MMAASGGLARIPVRSDMFEYAGGGIVAFAGGGSSDKEETEQERKEREAKILQEAIRKNGGKLPAGLKAAMAGLDVVSLPGRAVMGVANTGVVRPLRAMGADIPYIPEKYFMGDSSSMTPAYDQLRRAEDSYRAEQEREKNMRAVRNQGENMRPTMQNDPRIIGATPSDETVAAPVAGPTASPRPTPTRSTATPSANPSAAPQAGLPGALPARSPYFAQVNADLAKPIAAPTPEGIVAEQRALSPEAMQEEFMKKRMEEQRQRAAGERAAFEKSRPSGLDDLIRVFGQAGQYKGLSGMAPAYTANQQQRRAEELAMEQRQNQLLTGIDKSEYDSAKELFGARTGAMKEANKSFQDRLKSRSEVLAQMAGVDQRSIDEALNRLNAMQIAQLRTAAEARPSEAERIEATYMGLIAQNKPKEAEEFLQRISRIKRGGDKEDTLGKEIAKKRVEIAAMPDSKIKDQALAGLAALEKQQGGGAAAQTGKVVDFNSLPK
jgi:hypothetical protein